jgi:predicted nucleic acid-binding protein
MKATVNASPLIFLAKLGRLDLLPTPCGTTETVLDEVAGPARQWRPEAAMIRSLVEKGALIVGKPTRVELPEITGLHAGEASMLALAHERGIAEVIVDDRAAIRTAKLLDLKPISTAFLLLRAAREDHVSREGFRDLLDRLVAHGYHISPPLYVRLLDAVVRQ